jgi:hypothetical protein
MATKTFAYTVRLAPRILLTSGSALREVVVAPAEDEPTFVRILSSSTTDHCSFVEVISESCICDAEQGQECGGYIEEAHF